MPELKFFAHHRLIIGMRSDAVPGIGTLIRIPGHTGFLKVKHVYIDYTKGPDEPIEVQVTGPQGQKVK